MVKRRFAVAIMMLIGFACTSTTATAQINMAGNWSFSSRSSVYGLTISGSGEISQNGNAISGSLLLNSPCAASATFTGLINGSTVDMGVNESGQDVIFIGTVASTGSSASGTYNAPTGGCTSGDSGTWTASRVSTNSLSNVGAFAQIAAGGGWTTTIVLVNLSATPSNAMINLYGNNGSAISLPLLFPQTGATLISSSPTVTVPANGLATIETTVTQSSPTSVGWAQVMASGPLSGYAIFRLSQAGLSDSEGTAPLSVPSTTLNLPFDNTNGFSTGLALVNQSTQSFSNISISAFDANGLNIGFYNPVLSANEHISDFVSDLIQQTANQRGIIRIQFPGNSNGVALGLRFDPSGLFTSIPVIP